jgi:hypothetical protein
MVTNLLKQVLDSSGNCMEIHENNLSCSVYSGFTAILPLDFLQFRQNSFFFPRKIRRKTCELICFSAKFCEIMEKHTILQNSTLRKSKDVWGRSGEAVCHPCSSKKCWKWILVMVWIFVFDTAEKPNLVWCVIRNREPWFGIVLVPYSISGIFVALRSLEIVIVCTCLPFMRVPYSWSQNFCILPPRVFEISSITSSATGCPSQVRIISPSQILRIPSFLSPSSNPELP